MWCSLAILAVIKAIDRQIFCTFHVTTQYAQGLTEKLCFTSRRSAGKEHQKRPSRYLIFIVSSLISINIAKYLPLINPLVIHDVIQKHLKSLRLSSVFLTIIVIWPKESFHKQGSFSYVHGAHNCWRGTIPSSVLQTAQSKLTKSIQRPPNAKHCTCK